MLPTMRMLNGGYPTAQLFVGQLRPDTQEADLYNVFQYYGNVLEVRVARTPSGSSRCHAFVLYGSTDEADTAIATLHDVPLLSLGTRPQVSYSKHSELWSEFGRAHAHNLHEMNSSNPPPPLPTVLQPLV